MDINTQKVLVKAITDAQTKKVTPYTTTATVHNILGDTIYVKIQGSDILTPVKSSTVSVNKGDVVDLSVSHTDTHITGNRSDVATNKTVTNEIAGQYASEVLEIVATKYISTEDLYAINAEIKNLKAGTIEVEKLIASKATIEQLEVVNQKVGSLETNSATVDNLNAVKARVEALEAGTVTTDDLTTKYLTAEYIKSTYITTEDVATKYATIDLANVTNAWIVNGNIKEGAIGETEIADASITTAKIKDLSADVIKTGTLKTECLILTTDEIDSETGEKKVALITALNAKVNAGEDNVLDGAIIADDTIEASKITVVDLKAFGATIGNFHIETSNMYNGKTSLNDPTNGVYIGTDGIALGQGSLLDMTDDSPFRVESDGDFHLGGKDGNYINFDVFTGELDINAKTIKMGSSSVASTSYVDQKASEITSTVEDIDGRMSSMEQNADGFTWTIDETAIVSSVNEYYKSTSSSSLSGGSWSTSQPTWTEGTYIWMRTKNTNGKGTTSYTTAVCITGNTGATGNGIKSTAVSYQTWSNGTSTPTGSWSSTPPSTTADKPYLWTKTVITYTDDTTSTSYSVGSTPEGIVVGGRNLLSDTNVPSMTKKAGPGNKYLSDSGNSDYSTGEFVAVSNLPIPEFTHVYQFTCATASSSSTAGRSLCFYSGKTVPMIDGQEYTMSMYARKTSGSGKIRMIIGCSSYPDYTNYIDVTSEWKRYSYTFTYSDSATGGTGGARAYFGASCAVVGVVQTFGWKLEKGNKATDWNLSAADLVYASDEAAKTATNFMSYDSTNGLLIGNKTSGSWSGTRARITSDAFGILDSSGVELASYGATSRIGKSTGKNVYIDGDSIDIRNGTTVLATFDQYGLKIANSNDASGSLGSGTSKPALVIGSESGYHIEMDNNEIMAKSNATTSSHLFLNMEGGNVSVNNNCGRAIMFQDGAIYAKNSSYNNGSYLGIIDGLNENGNTTLGYGGYINNIGETNIYGEKINLRSNAGVEIEDVNGNEGLRVYGTDQVSIGYHGYSNNQGTTFLSGYDVWVRSSNYVYSDRRLRVLWSGAYYMKDGQSITLADAISDQLTGVILAWSAYDDGAAGNYDWNYIFVPKEHALRHAGTGVAMTLISSTGWTRASKYVYVSDTTISGHSNNNKESTEENGWIINPSRFVLRYVYGV